MNNNPYPIYAVQLKISEVTQNSNIDDIEIKPQSYIINTNFSSSTDMNAFIISGYSKINDKKWKRSIIYKIDSHSQIDIQLTIPPPSAQEEFKLEITDFSKEARDILENQQNATRVDFQIKINIFLVIPIERPVFDTIKIAQNPYGFLSLKFLKRAYGFE